MRSTRSQITAGSRRRQTALEAEEILDQYWSSGKTQRVFAGEMGIGVSSLQYWLRRSRARQPVKAKRCKTGSRNRSEAPSAVPLSLLEVDLAGDEERNQRSTGGFEIELRGGAQLRFGPGFAEGEVRRLLNLLREDR